jgi:hypothetical protein
MPEIKAVINKDLDQKQDHIYFDVANLITGEDDKEGLKAELLPGETIVKKFRVNTKIRDKRPKCYLYTMYVLTLGLYWVYINVCSCVRRKTAGNHRSMAAVTSRGRVLLWNSLTAGSSNNGTEMYNAQTNFRWFHLHSLTSTSKIQAVDKVCPCIDTKNRNTYFKLNIGSAYPEAGVWGRGRSGYGKNPVSVSGHIDWSGATALQGGAHSGLRGMLNSASGGASELVLEVHSGLNPPDFDQKMTWKDQHHREEESAFDEAIDFVRFVLNCKIAQPTLVDVPPRDHNVRVMAPGSKPDLIDGNVVQLDPSLVALAQNETVVDAAPVHVRMTCLQAVTCRFLCDRRLRSRTAIVLTTKRLLVIDEMKALDGDHIHEVEGHFLGNVHAGYIVRKLKQDVFGGASTNFGGLNLSAASVASRWCFSGDSDPAMADRLAQLWLLLANGVAVAGLSEEAARQLPPMPNAAEADAIKPELPLLPGENILAAVKSQNMWNLGAWDNPCISCLSCGRPLVKPRVIRALSCGLRAYEINMWLIITDFRVFSVSSVENDPWLPCFDKAQPLVVSWTTMDSLRSADLTGTWTTGVALGCLDRACAAAFTACNPMAAEMELRLGLYYAYKGHPFYVARNMPAAKEGGLIVGPDLLHFRRVLGVVLADCAAQSAFNVMEDMATGQMGSSMPAGAAKPV